MFHFSIRYCICLIYVLSMLIGSKSFRNKMNQPIIFPNCPSASILYHRGLQWVVHASSGSWIFVVLCRGARPCPLGRCSVPAAARAGKREMSFLQSKSVPWRDRKILEMASSSSLSQQQKGDLPS